VRLFRPVIEGKLTPAEAVEDYHAALAKKQIPSIRSLTADLKITDKILLGE
jgi:hypothetical protein